MQIILISDRLAKARSVNLSPVHLAGVALLGLALLCGATAAVYWFTLRYAAEFRIPVLERMVSASQEAEAERGRAFVQQNLNAMAMKLGEMQAQLTRLDALGERLSSLAGIRPQEFRFSEAEKFGSPWDHTDTRYLGEAFSSDRCYLVERSFHLGGLYVFCSARTLARTS